MTIEEFRRLLETSDATIYGHGPVEESDPARIDIVMKGKRFDEVWYFLTGKHPEEENNAPDIG